MNDIENVLKEGPTLLKCFQCWNLVSYFRTAQTDLTDFLTKPDIFPNLVSILQKSKDMNVVRVISNLFTSPTNTALLRQFCNSKEETMKLLCFFEGEKNKRPPPFAVGTCVTIFGQVFSNFPNEMYITLNSSPEIANFLLSNLNLLCVENVCNDIVDKSSASQAFCWISYRSLIGTYGTGGQTPATFAEELILNAKPITLLQQSRNVVLNLLIIFFSKYLNEAFEFSRIVVLALPVLMQKSQNDEERGLVMELALRLAKNEGIGRCAKSILFSNCNDSRLIELAFKYLTKFPPPPNSNELEILLFDVLNRRKNEFIIVSFLSFFRSQMNIFEITKPFVDHCRSIIIHSMKNQKSTLLLRAARVDMVNAINGKDSMFDIDDFAKDINKQRLNNCSSQYDHELIKSIKIFITNLASKGPIFDAVELWGQNSAIYEVNFSGFPNSRSGCSISSPLSRKAGKSKRMRDSLKRGSGNADNNDINNNNSINGDENDDELEGEDEYSSSNIPLSTHLNRSMDILTQKSNIRRRPNLNQSSDLASQSQSLSQNSVNSGSSEPNFVNPSSTGIQKTKPMVQSPSADVFKSRQIVTKKRQLTKRPTRVVRGAEISRSMQITSSKHDDLLENGNSSSSTNTTTTATTKPNIITNTSANANSSTNVNANIDINGDTNTDTNVNINTNTNSNANTNTNTNAKTNSKVPNTPTIVVANKITLNSIRKDQIRDKCDSDGDEDEESSDSDKLTLWNAPSKSSMTLIRNKLPQKKTDNVKKKKSASPAVASKISHEEKSPLSEGKAQRTTPNTNIINVNNININVINTNNSANNANNGNNNKDAHSTTGNMKVTHARNRSMVNFKVSTTTKIIPKPKKAPPTLKDLKARGDAIRS